MCSCFILSSLNFNLKGWFDSYLTQHFAGQLVLVTKSQPEPNWAFVIYTFIRVKVGPNGPVSELTSDSVQLKVDAAQRTMTGFNGSTPSAPPMPTNQAQLERRAINNMGCGCK